MQLFAFNITYFNCLGRAAISGKMIDEKINTLLQAHHMTDLKCARGSTLKWNSNIIHIKPKSAQAKHELKSIKSILNAVNQFNSSMTCSSAAFAKLKRSKKNRFRWIRWSSSVLFRYVSILLDVVPVSGHWCSLKHLGLRTDFSHFRSGEFATT